MQRLIGFIVLLALISIACQSAAAPTPTVQPTALPAIEFHTFTPEPTLAVTATEKSPAARPTLAGEFYAWNDLATIDGGGVTIQIARLVLADKSAVEMSLPRMLNLDDRPVVAAIIFIVQNSSDKTASVYPDQATVVASGEQIDLSEFMIFGDFGDDIGGEIFPGVTKIGGMWFGFRRTPVAAIQNMLISIHAPIDESFSRIGGEYNFELDLSQRKTDPVPEKLKSLQ